MNINVIRYRDIFVLGMIIDLVSNILSWFNLVINFLESSIWFSNF